MKILFIGFLAFFSWSTLSDYIYVCKIRGFCNEQEMINFTAMNMKETSTADTTQPAIEVENAVKPEELSIYFDSDKSELKSLSELGKYFDLSSEYLDRNTTAKLSITGHADAIGSYEYNQALGLRRAANVQRFFESKGIQAGRLKIESSGEKDPAGNNNTIIGRTKNRRTEITIYN